MGNAAPGRISDGGRPVPLRVGIAAGGMHVVDYYEIMEPLIAAGEVVVTMTGDPAPDTLLRSGQRREDRLRGYWPQAQFSSNLLAVAESPAVDAVLVLTPMTEHATIAKAALAAGKHVLVEKPFSTTLGDAAELITMARAGNRLLVPGPHVILSPTFRDVWRRVHAGEIGEVHLARARYASWYPEISPELVRPGAGAILDQAVYNVTSLTALLGPVERVTAFAGIAIETRAAATGEQVRVEATDNAQILLDFGQQRFGSVLSGFTVRNYRTPAVELYGGRGVINLLGHDWEPHGYETWHEDHQDDGWQVIEEASPGWSFASGFSHFVTSIRTGRPALVTPEHAYHVLEVLLAAEASARDGSARAIESRFAAPDLDRPPE